MKQLVHKFFCLFVRSVFVLAKTNTIKRNCGKSGKSK